MRSASGRAMRPHWSTPCCRCARLPADSPVELSGGSLTLREALSTRLEIAKLNAATAIRFSALADDAELLALVQPERAADLESYLYGRDALDLLARKPAAIGDAQALANLFPLLTPRLYSIASSLAAHPQEVHLTASVVRHARDGRPRGGVASTDFADRIDIDQTVPVYVHRNTRFRLPADPGTPIVMIGPGTGIAPFRSFLWHRKAHGYTGRTWLFFGDRHAHSDFLYQQELEAFIDDGTLVRLDTAFSRDQHEKVYVQHRILQAGAELWSWIADGAVIYVCGDATHMAKDVDAALRRLFVEHGRLSDAKRSSSCADWRRRGATCATSTRVTRFGPKGQDQLSASFGSELTLLPTAGTSKGGRP